MQDKIIRTDVDLENLPDFESIAGYMIPTDMANDAALTRVIEERYWYCTELGAATYIGLGQAQNTYTMYKETLDTLKKNIPDMMDKVFKIFTEWDNAAGGVTKKSMISFGIASANKEIAILGAFLKCCFKAKPITFVPVELSYPLLLYGLRQVQKKFHREIRTEAMKVHAAVTDYSKANINHFVDRGPRLITALGTVHSTIIDEFFTALKRLMDKQSLLLIDVEMIGQRSDEELRAPYDDVDSKKFIFSPMNLLLHAAKNDKGSFKGIEPVGSYDRFGDIKFNPDHIIVEVVTADTLDAYIKKYDLPVLARNMLRVDQHIRSKTVIQTYAPPHKPAYVIGHSTRFEEGDFYKVVEKYGFTIRGSWSEEGAANTYYLLSLKNA